MSTNFAPPPGQPPIPSLRTAEEDLDRITGIAAIGTLIQIRTSAEGVTPETYETIENVGDIDGPTQSVAEAETTSHSTGTSFRSFIPTLHDPGTLTFPCNFNPSDPTHSVLSPYGLEYMFLARTNAKFRLVNTDPSQRTRAFRGFVRELGEAYPVAGIAQRNTTIRITTPLLDVVPTLTLTPTTAAPLAAGGAATIAVAVTGGAGTWYPVSDAAWLTVTAPTEPQSVDGTVNYTVAANGAGQPSRVGHITVAGSTFTVTQAAGA